VGHGLEDSRPGIKMMFALLIHSKLLGYLAL